MATKFYKQIRCGILHQAEIKKSSKILIRDNIPLVRYSDDNQGLIIQRNLFHKQLVDEFESYIEKLRLPEYKELRKNFKKKMDYICRLSVETD
jgi:hypothetical protein